MTAHSTGSVRTTPARNAEIVRRGYEAFNTADMGTLTASMHEDIAWHTPGRSHLAGDHEGRDAAFAQFGRYGGETAGPSGPPSRACSPTTRAA